MDASAFLFCTTTLLSYNDMDIENIGSYISIGQTEILIRNKPSY